MTRRHLIGTGAATLCGPAVGLAADTATQPQCDAALAQAVEDFRGAMLNADAERFDALCADQLTYGHSAGLIETKAQFIEQSTNGTLRWKSIALSHQSHTIVDGVGIARHVLTGENEKDGTSHHVNIGILMVWHTSGNEWQLMARQAYRLG